MCSILAILGLAPGESESLRPLALERSRTVRHRGPDWSGVRAANQALLVHERLAIVDVEGGAQPLISPDGRYALAVNGEIYNHQALRREIDAAEPFEFTTQSDCEVITPLVSRHGPEAVARLHGMFAFVLHDEQTGRNVVARDSIGIIPLYWGVDEQGRRWVASELKALHGICPNFEEFPPGHWWDGSTEKPAPFFEPEWRDYEHVAGKPVELKDLRDGLESSVKSHLMGDVPYGVLLSGGLDSSIIAALAVKHAATRVDDNDQTEAWWPRVHSFAIGLEGSPDLEAAAACAEHLGTVHHGFTFTLDEGFDTLRDVIRHLETYDVTTIRAGTPMTLLARRIRSMGIKMVLSGEGADELFGGYLYFHKAPNAREFHDELVRKLSDLHLYDCLRANKAMSAYGVEARVPFLDRPFLETAMGFDAADKMCRTGASVAPEDQRIEKWALRKAAEDLLPDSIAWRQKEQFSDGVGYSWIDGLKGKAEREVSDQQMVNAAARFPVQPPRSKEAYLYRSIFDDLYPGEAAARCVPGSKSIACSTETALRWDATFESQADPSGRAVLGVHDDATEV